MQNSTMTFQSLWTTHQETNCMAFIFTSSYSLLKNEGGAGEMAQQLRALVALVRKFGSQHPHGETQSITYNSSSGGCAVTFLLLRNWHKYIHAGKTAIYIK